MKKPLIFLLTLFAVISLSGYSFNNNFVSAEKVYLKHYAKDKKNLNQEITSSRIFLNTRFLPREKSENPAKKDNWFDNFNFLKIGFYLLIIISLALLFLFAKYLSLKENDFDDFDFEEEVPIFHSQTEGKYNYESLNKKHSKETDEPFEVVWKHNSKQ